MKYIITEAQYQKLTEAPTENTGSMVFYHGTDQDFDKFSLENLGKNFGASSLGVYFTNNKMGELGYGSSAKEYAMNAYTASYQDLNYTGKPIIYTCRVRCKNPMVLDSDGWGTSVRFVDLNRSDIARAMKEDGHDCTLAYEFDEAGEYESPDDIEKILVTLDLSNIEIVDKEYLEIPEHFKKQT